MSAHYHCTVFFFVFGEPFAIIGGFTSSVLIHSLLYEIRCESRNSAEKSVKRRLFLFSLEEGTASLARILSHDRVGLTVDRPEEQHHFPSDSIRFDRLTCGRMSIDFIVKTFTQWSLGIILVTIEISLNWHIRLIIIDQIALIVIVIEIR